MPALFIFLLKVNVALLIFCAGYYLALRRLTFYTLNRAYLITAILFASVYPEINLSRFAQHSQQLTKPVQTVILKWREPAEKLIGPATQQNYWQWVQFGFWLGVLLLSAKLLIQLFSLFKLYRNSEAGQIYGHEVRIIKGNAGPFSFWKSIFVNPGNHVNGDLKAILLHEQVHVNEWHTLDILLAELSTIFYWFNPGVWLMKKAIRENIEFITDRKILNNGANCKEYQYSLINVGLAANSNNLVNNFNISTIKKRIIMMNAERSSKIKLTRYAFLLPAVIILLFVFTVSKAALSTNRSKTIAPVVKINSFKTIAPRNRFVRQFAVPAKLNNTVDTIVDKKVAEVIVDDTTAKLDRRGNGTVDIIAEDSDTNRVTKVRVKLQKIKPQYVKLNGNFTFFSDSLKNGKTVIISKRNFSSDTILLSKVKTDIKLSLDTVLLSKIKTNIKTNVDLASSAYKIKYIKRLKDLKPPAENSFSLNHLSDKLIIIDGKTATERDLKKLSAFDIEKMVLKTDEETKELYGEKAKNGVVFIVTKKAGK